MVSTPQHALKTSMMTVSDTATVLQSYLFIERMVNLCFYFLTDDDKVQAVVHKRNKNN